MSVPTLTNAKVEPSAPENPAPLSGASSKQDEKVHPVAMGILLTAFAGGIHLLATGFAAAGGAIQGAILGPSAGALAGTAAIVAFVAFPVLAVTIGLENKQIISENTYDILFTIGTVASMALGFGASYALGLVSAPIAIGGALLVGFPIVSRTIEHLILNNVSDENRSKAALFTVAAEICIVIAGFTTAACLGFVSPLVAALGVISFGFVALKATADTVVSIQTKNSEPKTDNPETDAPDNMLYAD
ncbi:MAG: hypothetical protein KDK62_02100 [Chlamydiia bacterium]|nr:hypothetical protein [Chlamydiia bacterium]